MIIINTTDSPHVIKVIPRIYNVDNAHNFIYIDSDTKAETTVTDVTKALDSGYISYSITLSSSEGKDYSFKIVDSVTTDIVFRGALFVTDQTTQNYRING